MQIKSKLNLPDLKKAEEVIYKPLRVSIPTFPATSFLLPNIPRIVDKVVYLTKRIRVSFKKKKPTCSCIKFKTFGSCQHISEAFAYAMSDFGSEELTRVNINNDFFSPKIKWSEMSIKKYPVFKRVHERLNKVILNNDDTI